MNKEEKKSEYEFIREHAIMKRIIVENGLWEKLLNDDEFTEYLREEYTGDSGLEKYINKNTCLRCGEGKPAYCEDCMQKVIAENAELQKERDSIYEDYQDLGKEKCMHDIKVEEKIKEIKTLVNELWSLW